MRLLVHPDDCSECCAHFELSLDCHLLPRCRCPPGHGDIFPSLLGSGMLEALRSEGVKYLFVSNSDNLGATLDTQLLAHFAASESAFLMEVRDC